MEPVSPEPPIVVYHAATMGNWQEVVREQMLLLRECGLAPALAAHGDAVRLTQVGRHLDGVLAEAARHDVPLRVVRTDENTDHYETFAMMEVERLAKEERVTRPLLYFHTKGVSAPHDPSKGHWRRAMGYHVLGKWRENLEHLKTHDAAGMNFWFHSENHFSGTFWMATADWIRKLPDFVGFHHAKNLVRYSCELWIGSTPGIRAMSHGCNDNVTWAPGYDYTWLLPPPRVPAETITWVTAVTPAYLEDAHRLLASSQILGPGHQFDLKVLPEQAWRHTAKLDVLRSLLPGMSTTHLFWIDADCEFLTTLRPRDFIAPDKPLSAVRHFAYGSPAEHLPDRLRGRLRRGGSLYHQACLFGGTVDAMAELLAAVAWMKEAGEGYDEHGLNIEWDAHPEKVHTLPCRYAAPSTFAAMPTYQASYEARAGGAARVVHHNREIHRK